MKLRLTVFTLIFAASFTATSMAQEVEMVQKSLVIKIAADWCPNCGTYGWSFFDDIIHDNQSDAIFLAAHHSGGLRTVAGETMSSNFNIPYQPYFIVNNQVIEVSSSTASGKRVDVKNQIQSHISQNPDVALGMDVGHSNNEFKAWITVEFTKATSGEYYVGIYGVRDHVIAYQSSRGDNADHRYLLREAADVLPANVFGKMVASGSINAGDSYNLTFDLEGNDLGLDFSFPREDESAVAVVWKKVGNQYQFVNAIQRSGNEFELVNTNNLEKNPLSFTAIAAESGIQLFIDSDMELKNASVESYDINGRLLNQFEIGQVPNGKSKVMVPLNNAGQISILRLTSNSGSATYKLFNP